MADAGRQKALDTALANLTKRFGDGTIIDDYVSYSEISHRFKSSGIHVVTARSTIDGMLIVQKRKVIVGGR